MWHIGIHIWDVDPNTIEPNYDEYYAVRLCPDLHVSKLTISGANGVQSAEHSDLATRQSFYHPTSSPRRVNHHMAEESAVLHLGLHCRKCADTLVLVHLHMPTANR
jgi:hypothetical protein